jgi:transglutaminase-like putative cysteine protease
MFVHGPFALTLFLSMLSMLPAGVALAGTRWQHVSVEGRKVGHVEITRTALPDGVLETKKLEMWLGKTDRRVRFILRVETESGTNGAFRRLSRELTTPEGHSQTSARVVGADLEIVAGEGRSRTTRRLEGAAHELRSLEFARAWLADVGAGGTPAALRFRSWDPVSARVVEVEMRGVAREGANVERRLRDALGSSVTHLRADARGNVVREIVGVGAFEFVVEDATKGEARAANAVFDHIAPLLQPAPYRIPARDMRAKIRYAFDNHGIAATIPTGAGQRTWADGRTTWIQVCASCDADAAPLDSPERARALAPSQWLQSSHPSIVNRARRVAAGSADARVKMRRLTTFVRGHMSTKIGMLGYGSALEALETRRGDCTEFAVLLAALGRAIDVPTRVVVGRVYARRFEGSRHVFVPHAWVQAWTGTGWESFDAAIGTFDSTHLAFAVSYDGNAADLLAGTELARKLTMTGAARVVPRRPAR